MDRRVLFLICLGVVVCGCIQQSENPEPQEINSDTFIEITLEGGGLYGGINPFTIDNTIKNDGGIIRTYHGPYTNGTVTHITTRKDVEELAQLIVESGFFEMKDYYACGEKDQECKNAGIDYPPAVPLEIEVIIGNSGKSVGVEVFHYFDEKKIDYPDELDEIYDRFYKIVNEAKKAEGKIYTPKEVLEKGESLVNRTIKVKGLANFEPVICTEMACPPPDYCCNTCSGALVLEANGSKIYLAGGYNGAAVGCDGSECEMDCYPLEPKKEYLVTGVLREDIPEDITIASISDYVQFYLEIIDFEYGYNGVNGYLKIISGDMMPGPGMEGRCCFENFVSADIYFVNIETNESHAAKSNLDGYFEINLPNGEYFMWPDAGWGASSINKNCLLNLSNCTEKEHDTIIEGIDYIKKKRICESDNQWLSNSNCKVLINDSKFNLNITIENISS